MPWASLNRIPHPKSANSRVLSGLPSALREQENAVELKDSGFPRAS